MSYIRDSIEGFIGVMKEDSPSLDSSSYKLESFVLTELNGREFLGGHYLGELQAGSLCSLCGAP